VIGNAPPQEILDLSQVQGVVVHGYVQDISPMFRNCRLSIAPLRYGAGIKGKIGTSLAYGVPVVATSIAVEGMQVDANVHVLVADTPATFAKRVVELYKSKTQWEKMSRAGRRQMAKEYSPAAGLGRIADLMRNLNPEHLELDLCYLRSFEEYQTVAVAVGEDLDMTRSPMTTH